MSLQERTLVIKNFDPNLTTNELLKELCIQAGPLRNVVLKTDHAFVEFEDVDSVAYAKALLDGVRLFGRPLVMEPKLRDDRNLKYTKLLNDYIAYDKEQEKRRLQDQLGTMVQLNGQQMQFPMIPPTQPHYQGGIFQTSNNSGTIQQLKQQNFVPQQPIQFQQAPPFINQMQHQFPRPLPPQVSPYQTYQAPPEIIRDQLIQTSPYIANPLRPPPEGRGYLPWLHEPHMDRARSLYNMNQNQFVQHQQFRRLSDRPPDFSKRRK